MIRIAVCKKLRLNSCEEKHHNLDMKFKDDKHKALDSIIMNIENKNTIKSV